MYILIMVIVGIILCTPAAMVFIPGARHAWTHRKDSVFYKARHNHRT